MNDMKNIKVGDVSANLKYLCVVRDREREDLEMKSGELEYHLRQLLEAGTLTRAIPGCYCDDKFCMGDNYRFRLLPAETPYGDGLALAFPVEGVTAQHLVATPQGSITVDVTDALSPQYPLLTEVLRWMAKNGIGDLHSPSWLPDRIDELHKKFGPFANCSEKLPSVPFINTTFPYGVNNGWHELYDAEGVVAYRARFVYLLSSVLLIPYRYYRHVESGVEFALPFFPKEPAFFGSPPRADSPRQTVYLSDELEIVLANPGRVLGILFERDREISPGRLTHHECYWLLDGAADRDSYQRLLLFLDHCRRVGLSIGIKQYHKQKSSFDNTPCIGGCESPLGRLCVESISRDEFVREASKRGCHIPDDLRLDRNGRVDFSSLPETRTLISDLLDSDDVLLVEEMQEVPPHCFTRWLVQACSSGEPLFQHFSLSKKLSVLLFVTEGEERTVTKGAGDGAKVYHPDFFTATSGIDMFKEIVSETTPDIVVFDVESLAATRDKDIFLQVLSHCKCHEIGIVVVWSRDLLGDDISSWLRSKAQRRVYFMALPGTGYAYEEFSDAHLRFKIDLDGQAVEEELSAVELESIPGRDKLVGQGR